MFRSVALLSVLVLVALLMAGCDGRRGKKGKRRCPTTPPCVCNNTITSTTEVPDLTTVDVTTLTPDVADDNSTDLELPNVLQDESLGDTNEDLDENQLQQSQGHHGHHGHNHNGNHDHSGGRRRKKCRRPPPCRCPTESPDEATTIL